MPQTLVTCILSLLYIGSLQYFTFFPEFNLRWLQYPCPYFSLSLSCASAWRGVSCATRNPRRAALPVVFFVLVGYLHRQTLVIILVGHGGLKCTLGVIYNLQPLSALPKTHQAACSLNITLSFLKIKHILLSSFCAVKELTMSLLKQDFRTFSSMNGEQSKFRFQ